MTQGMEVERNSRSQWETVVHPEIGTHRQLLPHLGWRSRGKMKGHPDAWGRDARRILELHQAWNHTVGFGTRDPEETLPVFGDHSATVF